MQAGGSLEINADGVWSEGGATSGPEGRSLLWQDNFFNLTDLGVCSTCAVTTAGHYNALIGYVGSAPPQRGSYTNASVRPETEKIFVVGSLYPEPAGTRFGRVRRPCALEHQQDDRDACGDLGDSR